ncbi:MAG: hypothetical protein ACK4M7_03145, partial [Burkholderiales bacterium]
MKNMQLAPLLTGVILIWSMLAGMGNAEEAEKRAQEERELRIQKEYEERAEQYVALGIEKPMLVKI